MRMSTYLERYDYFIEYHDYIHDYICYGNVIHLPFDYLVNLLRTTQAPFGIIIA